MYKLVEWTLNFINRAYVNLVYFYYLSKHEGGTRPLLLGFAESLHHAKQKAQTKLYWLTIVFEATILL